MTTRIAARPRQLYQVQGVSLHKQADALFRYVAKKKKTRGPTKGLAQRIAFYDSLIDTWERTLTANDDELRKDIDDLRAYRATLTYLEPPQPIWLRRLDRKPKQFQPREPSYAG